jgi:hypothetical protein
MTSSVAGFAFFGLAFATLYAEYATTIVSQEDFLLYTCRMGGCTGGCGDADVPKNNTLNLLDIVARTFRGCSSPSKAMQQSTP